MALPSSAWVPTTMSICAVGEALLGLGQLRRRRPGARPARCCTGKPREALGEGLEVLAREQRGRHHDRDLLAAHRRDEGGAQRHLGLAEADVAADQPVHRPAGGEVVEHGVDGGLLVVGLLVGEARRRTRRRGPAATASCGASRNCRSAAILISSSAISRMRFFMPRLARLPGGAAEPVELDAGLLRAVARQKLDVLDRQEQLVAAGVVDLEAVVRRAGRLDGVQADEAADAVIDMDDEVAGGEARRPRR